MTGLRLPGIATLPRSLGLCVPDAPPRDWLEARLACAREEMRGLYEEGAIPEGFLSDAAAYQWAFDCEDDEGAECATR
jgi:hypothetical protein